MAEEASWPEGEGETDIKKVGIGILVAAIILGIVVYGGYTFSQRRAGKQIFPAGFPLGGGDSGGKRDVLLSEVNCESDTPQEINPWAYYIRCDPFTAAPNETWVTYTDPDYGFSISLPESLDVIPYGKDLGVAYKELAPFASSNLLYIIDLADIRSGEFVTMGLVEYANNYWQQYSGLTGIQSAESFTNVNGLRGMRAVYINSQGETPSTEVFFEFPDRPGNFVHLASGVLEPSVFDRIVDSFRFGEAATPEATPAPVATPAAPTP